MNSLTVSDILKLDILKNVSIHAGVSGLSRTVKGITTAEDPDLIQWLKGGEVLITSLYGAATGHYSFDAYIKELASKNISALIIKPGSKLSEIPKEIIENGNLYSIPIIELPEDITFIEVVSAVMSLILANKTSYYIEVQNKLSQLLASGAQEQDILDYLVTYIPARITLCDADKNLLFHAESEDFHAEIAIADRISLPVMSMGEVNGYLEAVLNHFLEENLENLL